MEIKSLDPTTKYSSIVHLEEFIDLLKLEALKELPEENIKDEDGSSNNFDNDYHDSDDEGTLPESNTSNESVAAYEKLSVEKSLYICDIISDIDNTKENHAINSSANQEVNEEKEIAMPVSNIDIKEEPRSHTEGEVEDPTPSAAEKHISLVAAEVEDLTPLATEEEKTKQNSNAM